MNNREKPHFPTNEDLTVLEQTFQDQKFYASIEGPTEFKQLTIWVYQQALKEQNILDKDEQKKQTEQASAISHAKKIISCIWHNKKYWKLFNTFSKK